MADPNSQPLWAQSATSSTRLLREGRVTARQLTEACFARIAEVDDRIHSFHHVAASRARAAADAADADLKAGWGRSALHGIAL